MQFLSSILAAAVLLAAAPASAALLSFDLRCLSSGIDAACAAGRPRFALAVTDEFAGALPGQVLFAFPDIGAAASVVD